MCQTSTTTICHCGKEASFLSNGNSRASPRLQLMPSLLSFSQSHFHKLAAGPMDSQGSLKGFFFLMFGNPPLLSDLYQWGQSGAKWPRICHKSGIAALQNLLQGSPDSERFIKQNPLQLQPAHQGRTDSWIWIHLPPKVWLFNFRSPSQTPR